MSPNITDRLAPEKVARIAGGFYLAYILASVLATMLANIGLGDAQQVYQAIVTNEGSFRLGLVIALTTGSRSCFTRTFMPGPPYGWVCCRHATAGSA